MQAESHVAASIQQSNQAARWLALIGGVVVPVAFVLAYTVAGALRPGYSPIHQAISDLGVGPNGWMLDAFAAIQGVLLIGLAFAFAILMRRVLSPVWLWLGTGLLVLHGLARITVSIFTDAPATVRIHSLATLVSLISLVGAVIVIGLALRLSAHWRGLGTYSLIVGLVTLALFAFDFWVFTPGTPLAPAQIGGLVERLVSLALLAWYVAFGWRLFRLQE